MYAFGLSQRHSSKNDIAKTECGSSTRDIDNVNVARMGAERVRTI